MGVIDSEVSRNFPVMHVSAGLTAGVQMHCVSCAAVVYTAAGCVLCDGPREASERLQNCTHRGEAVL